MDKERLRKIASDGGKTAHQEGVAHRFDSESARKAGKRGGIKIAENRSHMAAIGRRGGLAKEANRQRRLAVQTETERTASQSKGQTTSHRPRRMTDDPRDGGAS